MPPGKTLAAFSSPSRADAVKEKPSVRAEIEAAPVAEPAVRPKARKTARPAEARETAPSAKRSSEAPPQPAAAPSAAPAAAPVRRRRRNRRSEETIENILAATEQVVLESGADRISILEVCEVAGVSRGTFYRYFNSQEELLDAFSRHKRDRFHQRLVDATAPYTDPDERFQAVVAYLESYLETGVPHRLLKVAPEYALGFFKRIFHDSIVRFQDVLGLVFDAWDERLGVKLDRELICELMIRYVLSEQLVPAGNERRALPRRIGRLIEALTIGSTPRLRR